MLWPHGVLFRNEEQAMRAKMIEHDWVEAMIGLAPNLFYNSPMESCILVYTRRKQQARKGRVLFIDALSEVTRERAQSFLTPAHQQRIVTAFRTGNNEPGFSALATLGEIAANSANHSIPMYVMRASAPTTGTAGPAASLQAVWAEWQTGGRDFWRQMGALVETLDGLGER